MDWKQIIAGLVIGALLGVASTFFLFQGRISKLEALIAANSNQEKTSISSETVKKPVESDNTEVLLRKSNYRVKIDSPKDGDKVIQNITIRGKSFGDLSDLHLWAVVHPIGSMGWWPQNSEIIPDPSDGSWEISVILGQKNDVGKKFEIAAVLTSKNAHESFIQYLRSGAENNDYPEKPLPTGTRILEKVIVERR